MAACALTTITTALWLFRIGRIAPFAKAAIGSRRRQIIDLAGIGAFGLFIGFLAPGLVPLAGIPAQVTVTIVTNVYAEVLGAPAPMPCPWPTRPTTLSASRNSRWPSPALGKAIAERPC